MQKYRRTGENVIEREDLDTNLVTEDRLIGRLGILLVKKNMDHIEISIKTKGGEIKL